MDRFEAMQIIVAISEGGSLSSASRKLKIPLATVSRKVSELENHLKVKLLNRTTRAVEFTDYGRTYLTHCLRILDDIHEAERTVTGEYSAPKGVLAITAPILFGKLYVVPVVADFLKAYPEVNIQLFLSDRSVNILEEKIDLAIRIGELPDSSLLSTKVGEIRQVVCGSPAYFKKHGKPKRPEDLKAHHCVSITSIGSSKNWTFKSGKTKLSAGVRTRLEVSTVEAGLEAAALGVGITRALSYQTASFKEQNRLEIILQTFDPDPWPVHLVHGAGRIVPIKLRAFLDFATPRLKEKLKAISTN